MHRLETYVRCKILIKKSLGEIGSFLGMCMYELKITIISALWTAIMIFPIFAKVRRQIGIAVVRPF